MIVIMDMEWITDKTNRFCPTQISALRVDMSWQCLDRFDALIKPYDASCYIWDHVAYSGADPEAFLQAPSGISVFNALNRWLRKDDVLCWWGDQPALVFKTVFRHLLHCKFDYPMRLIYKAWRDAINDGYLKSGSPYILAKDRKIPYPSPEHRAANDVDVINALLFKTVISQDIILNTQISPDARIINYGEYRTTPKRKSQYYVDREKNIVHSAKCENVTEFSSLQGLDSLVGCIRKHIPPCDCCYNAYWETNRRYLTESISKHHYSFVYAKHSNIFHKPDCKYVEKIHFADLMGSAYYSTCFKHNLECCELCNPSPEDEVPPLHYYSFPSKSTISEESIKREKPVLMVNRRLSQKEKNAYYRFETAVKERDRISSGNTMKTLDEQRDAFVLNQSGFAFWSGKGYQNFHTRFCPKLEHITNLTGFARYQDAIRKGLTPCKVCRPSPASDIVGSVPIYQKQRPDESTTDLDRLCDGRDYSHHMNGREYFIDTSVGKWKIIIGTLPVDLYHLNITKASNTNTYHKQPHLFLSLTDTFEYIHRHDTALMNSISENFTDT